MNDLRNKLNRYRRAMADLDIDTSNVDWQSFAILSLHCTQPDQINLIRRKLMDEQSGWFRDGYRDGSDGTSLYLSPKGMPYWLHYGGHSTLYHELFGASQSRMDEAGWLHISGGRVDVHAAITSHQRRWLERHQPHPKSYHAERGSEGHRTWRVKPYDCNSDRKQPVPYPLVEKFDVMPVRDLDHDWDRFMARIERAANPPTIAA